jgi:hypothetical protein
VQLQPQGLWIQAKDSAKCIQSRMITMLTLFTFFT